MTRIQLLSGHGEVSGGEQMLRRIAITARELGHEVKVVGPKWGSFRGFIEAAEVDYQPLVGVSRRSYGLALAAYAARKQGAILWANGAMPGLAAAGTRDPLILHLHQLPSRWQWRALAVGRRRARAVVVPSEFMAAAIPDSTVLLNWTGSLRRLPRPTPGGPFKIAYVGRISVDKGVDTLVQAVATLARDCVAHDGNGSNIDGRAVDIELTLAGDSRFVPDSQAKQVGYELAKLPSNVRVAKPGWVDPQKVYAEADVAVVPSRWPEPFGLVAAEAMGVGCPLVVSSAGALPEVVGSRYPWVFDAGDAVALAGLLGSVRGSSQRDVVCDKARERWEGLFAPAAGEKRLRRLLQTLMAPRG